MQNEINFANLEIRKLRESDSVNDFDCGDSDLNEFILQEASAYKKAMLAVSYIVVEKENPKKVLGFQHFIWRHGHRRNGLVPKLK